MGLDEFGARRMAAWAQDTALSWERLAGAVDALRVRRESRCRRVAVTVDGTGGLVDVEFTDRFRTADPGELSAAVLHTLRRAQAGLADRVAGLVDPEVFDGGLAALDAVVASYRRRYPPIADGDPGPPPVPPHEPPHDDGGREFRWLRR